MQRPINSLSLLFKAQLITCNAFEMLICAKSAVVFSRIYSSRHNRQSLCINRERLKTSRRRQLCHRRHCSRLRRINRLRHRSQIRLRCRISHRRQVNVASLNLIMDYNVKHFCHIFENFGIISLIPHRDFVNVHCLHRNVALK